jgi:hypothetical protein
MDNKIAQLYAELPITETQRRTIWLRHLAGD